MTKDRIVTLRSGLLLPTQEIIHECLDEIERLENIATIQAKQIEHLREARDAEAVLRKKAEDKLKNAKRLPDSMREAFNSGDGSYRP